MNLYRGFGGSEFSGYLFIEQAGNHPGQHLALARSERFQALPEHCGLRLPLSPGAVTIQRLVNRIQQILVAEGLGQEFDGSRFHCPYRHADIAVAGDKDDWNVDIGLSQLTLKIESAFPA